MIDALVLAAFAAHELTVPQRTFRTGKNLHQQDHVNNQISEYRQKVIYQFVRILAMAAYRQGTENNIHVNLSMIA